MKISVLSVSAILDTSSYTGLINPKPIHKVIAACKEPKSGKISGTIDEARRDFSTPECWSNLKFRIDSIELK